MARKDLDEKFSVDNGCRGGQCPVIERDRTITKRICLVEIVFRDKRELFCQEQGESCEAYRSRLQSLGWHVDWISNCPTPTPTPTEPGQINWIPEPFFSFINNVFRR